MLSLPLAFFLSGCGLFYENSYRGPGFRIYSDRSPDFVEKVGEKVGKIYGGYRELFALSPARLGTTTIVLEGKDNEEVNPDYSPSVLGYYVPLFNYISVDTNPAWARTDSMLQQVLLHEITHHFVVTEFPAASRQCWLNEGLAGNLEVTLFESEHFEYPLLNPALFPVAQKAAYEADPPLRLRNLIDMSWSDFHNTETKERNYALAWSIVYFLLERHLSAEMPLGERMETLYSLEASRIDELEAEWLAFLRGFDVTGRLLELASNRSTSEVLTARWAVLQLGSLRSLDDLRVLTGLVEVFDDPDREKQLLAYLSFLKTLERNPHSFFFSEAKVQRGLRRISKLLDDPGEPLLVRQTLTQALQSGSGRAPPEFSRFFALLQAENEDLWRSTARLLSRFTGQAAMVHTAHWVEPEDPGEIQAEGELSINPEGVE